MKKFKRKKWASPEKTYKEAEDIAENTLKPYKAKKGPYSGKKGKGKKFSGKKYKPKKTKW